MRFLLVTFLLLAVGCKVYQQDVVIDENNYIAKLSEGGVVTFQIEKPSPIGFSHTRLVVVQKFRYLGVVDGVTQITVEDLNGTITWLHQSCEGSCSFGKEFFGRQVIFTVDQENHVLTVRYPETWQPVHL